MPLLHDPIPCVYSSGRPCSLEFDAQFIYLPHFMSVSFGKESTTVRSWGHNLSMLQDLEDIMIIIRTLQDCNSSLLRLHRQSL